MYFDLRLPFTSVLKQLPGSYRTLLNHEDREQPAFTPTRTHMRIYSHITGTDWIVEVKPRSSEYVTVEDVLMAIYDTLSVQIDDSRWERDSVDPKLKDRVEIAFYV